jgi:hypothetical protein
MLDTAVHPLFFHSVAPILLPPTERALVDFDNLVRTGDLLRAALHIVEHGLSTELCPISNGCGAEQMQLLDSVGSCAANVVVREANNFHESEVTLLKP